MVKYLVSLVFIVSIALAAGGIILSTRLRNRQKPEFFSTLLYFQVFIYTFGFYGIWGQVVVNFFLSPYLSEELLSKITDVAMLLGLPFLVFAWLMLIQFSLDISGRKRSGWMVLWFLASNFLIILVVGYIILKISEIKPDLLLKYYFILMNFIYSIAASLLIAFPLKGRSVIHNYDRRIIAPVIVLSMTAQSTVLFFYTSQYWFALIFIFLYFAGNAFIPVYLNYGTLLSSFTEEPKAELSFEEFCRKFEVSPRESDIVREICNGLSNKEISEKLFISLQTVKDHTHRIYIKTNVKSRVQLITLVKEEVGM
jgi:DNA-binding CsgD family transcriptional regulator